MICCFGVTFDWCSLAETRISDCHLEASGEQRKWGKRSHPTFNNSLQVTNEMWGLALSWWKIKPTLFPGRFFSSFINCQQYMVEMNNFLKAGIVIDFRMKFGKPYVSISFYSVLLHVIILYRTCPLPPPNIFHVF